MSSPQSRPGGRGLLLRPELAVTSEGETEVCGGTEGPTLGIYSQMAAEIQEQFSQLFDKHDRPPEEPMLTKNRHMPSCIGGVEARHL